MTPERDVPAHRLKQMKRAMRREVLARRDALPEAERAAKSSAISERLLALPEIEAARTIMLFWSFGSEVDTSLMIERLAAERRHIVLPRIESDEALPVTYRPGDPVSETTFGAMEPSAGAVLDPERLDAVVAPGVAFDRAGNRIGYGGGFYDRMLRRTRADIHTMAVAFAVQLVDAVPVGHQDRRVDIVVTEDEVIRHGGT